MSILQDEQLERIEKQGKSRQLYKIEFFATVLICTVVTTLVLSQFAPEGQSSIPITFEAITFSVVLSLLASPWAGRLIVLVFAGSCAIFVAVKLNALGQPTFTNYPTSFYLWIGGVSLFVVALIIWKVISVMDPDNKEAREYEKEMRRLGRW